MRPKNFGDHDAGQRGWALVSVLWVLSILAMLAAATQLLTLTSARAERRAWEHARIEAVLDAGLTRTILGIRDSRVTKRWRVDGAPQAFEFEGEHLTVRVQDELGRIDLNAADGSLLRQLLRSTGLTSSETDKLGDTILDWRSPYNFSRLHAATDADYAKAGLTYRPRHGPFQTVEELGLVLGMSPALLKQLRPALTVYSKHPAIDPTVAPKEALRAYFPNQPARVEQILRDRLSPATAGLSGSGSMTSSHPYDITVELTRGSMHYRRVAVVAFTGIDSQPPIIYAWR